MPITSNPDAFYLSDEDFIERFGFEKPKAVRASSMDSDAGKEGEAEDGGRGAGYGEEGGEGKGVEEVIFYCKAGVRSRAAARMAREWVGIRAGDMSGGWLEWEKRGGEVER